VRFACSGCDVSGVAAARISSTGGCRYWVQGRCEMVLGNEGEGDFVKPLSIGAKAIYDRTKGVCPA
jgi:hypothetical protein